MIIKADLREDPKTRKLTIILELDQYDIDKLLLENGRIPKRIIKDVIIKTKNA